MNENKIGKVLEKLGLTGSDIFSQETGVSLTNEKKTVFLVRVSSDKFVDILLKINPKTIYYEGRGRDDAGKWAVFGICIEKGIEVTTLAQPYGDFDSGIFNKVSGYRHVVDHESFPMDVDEKGRYILD